MEGGKISVREISWEGIQRSMTPHEFKAVSRQNQGWTQWPTEKEYLFWLFSNRAKKKTAIRCVGTKLTPCPIVLIGKCTSLSVWKKKHFTLWDKPKTNKQKNQGHLVPKWNKIWAFPVNCWLLSKRTLFIIFVMLTSEKCIICRFDNDRSCLSIWKRLSVNSVILSFFFL